MTPNDTPTAPLPAPALLPVKALAARWGVSTDTARNTVRSGGFPAPLILGPRTRRWPEQEVAAWEQQRRARAAHVVTGTRPQHRVQTAPKPAQVRRVVTRPNQAA